MPELLLIGTSHRQGSLQGRVRFVATPDRIQACLARARSAAALSEVLLLATCNRMEWYATGNDRQAMTRALHDAAAAEGEGDLTTPAGWYVKTNTEARLHLCRVACGLESAVLGEVEIQGQVRRAAAAAREAGTLGPVLARVVDAALRAGKRSRSSTGISHGVQSAAAAAVSLVVATCGSIAGSRVVVLGAGSSARQALMRLRAEAPSRLVVVSRSVVHAREAAAATGAEAIALADLDRELTEAHAIIAATSTPEPLISVDSLRSLVRPPLQVFVDLSVPPATDPAIASIAGVRRHDLADVEGLIRRARSTRERDVPLVEAIAIAEADRWSAGRISRRSLPGVSAASSAQP